MIIFSLYVHLVQYFAAKMSQRFILSSPISICWIIWDNSLYRQKRINYFQSVSLFSSIFWSQIIPQISHISYPPIGLPETILSIGRREINIFSLYVCLVQYFAVRLSHEIHALKPHVHLWDYLRQFSQSCSQATYPTIGLLETTLYRQKRNNLFFVCVCV
jgi:hypothetical protein